MKPDDNIHKLIKKFQIEPSADMDKKVHDRITKALQRQKNTKSVNTMPNFWRIIMNNKITKFAAAAVIIIAIMISMNRFGGSIDGSSVAFGEVLEYFQTFSYTFDLTVDATEGDQIPAAFKMQAMVAESGRMRLDCPTSGAGKVSSIIDFNADRTLLLFHQNKAAVIKKESFLNKMKGAGGIISFCTKPIKNLWNMRDGTEEHLGEKEISGQKVTGFRILQEDQYFHYDITIWANSKSGIPSMVKTIATPIDESYPSIKWTMENFNLDVELDEELFSIDPPEGYTLAYQEDLETLEVDTQPSDESKKIVQMLELWSESKNDQAIESLLKVDWTKKIEFGKEPYIFSLTEKQYISIKAQDQQQVMQNIMATSSTIRNIVKEVWAIGKTAITDQDYEGAEQYFNAALQVGKLLDRNPEGIIIARTVGISVERITLNEMISLYTITNNQEKLQNAEKQQRTAEAELDKIKKQASGH